MYFEKQSYPAMKCNVNQFISNSLCYW